SSSRTRARAPSEPRGPCGLRVRGSALKPGARPRSIPVAIPRALPAPLTILLSARFPHLCHHQLRLAIDYTPMHYRVIMAAGCGREVIAADVGTVHQGFSIKHARALAASPLTGARPLVIPLTLLRVVSR